MNLGVSQVPAVPWVIVVRLPLKIESEGNRRDHWRTVGKRKKEQREVARMAVAAHLANTPMSPPLLVTLTRIGPRKLDSDNVVGGFKFVRDGVAKALGIDDGDRKRIGWNYAQRASSPKSAVRYGIEILIEERPHT